MFVIYYRQLFYYVNYKTSYVQKEALMAARVFENKS